MADLHQKNLINSLIEEINQLEKRLDCISKIYSDKAYSDQSKINEFRIKRDSLIWNIRNKIRINSLLVFELTLKEFDN